VKEKRVIHLEKRADGSIYPADGESAQIWSEMRIGKWKFEAVPVKSINRNLYHHKKYFKMLQLALDNQERFPSLDQLRKAVLKEAGFYHLVYTFDGIVKEADSISFNKMGQEEFEKVYSKSVDVLMKAFGWHREMFDMLMSFI
jgi:hypothetical protein